MNNNYVLIYRCVIENGIEKREKLNYSGEWKEETFKIDLTKKQKIIETPPTYKNISIITLQFGRNYHKDKYDSLGRVVKTKYYNNNILTSHTEFKYNNPFTKMKCDRIISYKRPKTIQYSMKIKYNSEGELLKRSCYYPDGDLAWYVDFIYNNEHQNTEILTYNNENVLMYKKFKLYDSNNDIIKIEKYIHKDYFNLWKRGNGGKYGFYLWTDGN